MLRKDIINAYVYEVCKGFKKEDITSNSNIGVTAQEIANELNIYRNNVSSDLNKLFDEEILIKIKGKPTKFFSKEILENLLSVSIQGPLEFNSLFDIINVTKKSEVSFVEENPFSKLTGFDESLKSIIKLGKAAVLYPPNGLHTIILGDSGVGKSYFAELMYEFGIKENVFSNSSNFIVFNCADYASNPQLLIAHLFGSKKGAYTGADTDKIGLIEKADGGVLFLDEIHRLPPEGQEMLFLFIDKKVYSRLGEVDKKRSASVFIIAATTESPKSSLLTTFMRRIPMTIVIPSLKERTLNEKIKIVEDFYRTESKNINHEIIVTKKVLFNLITYNPPGNIGQLKSDIQLSVARAFLESKINKNKEVKIDVDYLPNYTSKGILELNKETRKQLEFLLNEEEYSFSQSNGKITENIQPTYDFITYYKERLDANAESLTIQQLFNDYTQKISKNMTLSNNYPMFYTDETKEIISILSDVLYEELNLIIDKSTSIALALYLSNLEESDRDNLHNNKYSLRNYDIPDNVYKATKKIIQILEKRFNIYCPANEIVTLGSIINSFKSKKENKSVKIFVVAHGESLATNIADVVNELLDISYVIPVDMSLNERPETVIDSLIEKINETVDENGAILFVDMGSLANVESVLRERTVKNLVALESINTLLILEATRKAIFLRKDINDILNDLLLLNNKLTQRFNKNIERRLSLTKKRVIYTVCLSGEGIAFYLEKNIKHILKELNIYDVEVIPISSLNCNQLNSIIDQTSNDKEVVSIVGSVDPMIEGISFISLEEILLSNGINKILTQLGLSTEIERKVEVSSFNRSIILDVGCETVDKYLVFLSAEKVASSILSFIDTLEEELNIMLSNTSILKLFIHMSCMIERILFKENTLRGMKIDDVNMANKIKNMLSSIEVLFNIEIKDDEIYYISEIIKDNIKEI
ncbi:PTS system transcriptional activator [Clostridium sp. DL-VIII]|uniref:sigma 54-interacting transcriptional regulator n=1 Tax=Clostridium sp. DL-VIII TaxID=641107 RepID=UPI00023B016D|nr:sigma 54-interacting transcriptional regulator [Clostridium sp. DL-VIII]EHI99227.1 PTS system transcriptional activator [Clostridium sp. DL-VIII]